MSSYCLRLIGLAFLLLAAMVRSTVDPSSGTATRQNSTVVVRSVGVYDEHGSVCNTSTLAALLHTNKTTVILIHIAKKHFHNRLVVLRETWLNRHYIPHWASILFYTTTEDGPVPGTIPTILVDTNEKPHDGNEQILSAFTLSYQHFFTNASHLQWLVKVDDDSYLSWTSLEKALQKRDPKVPQYVGDCDCTSPGWQDKARGCVVDYDCTPLEGVPTFKYACGGSGIVLSRSGLKLLVREEVQRRCVRTLEDITIAHCLLPSNVRCEELPFTAFLSLKTFGQKFLRSATDVDFANVCIWEAVHLHELHALHNRYMKVLGIAPPPPSAKSNSTRHL